MFVFDDVGVVSTFRVPKTCCLPISTKRKKNTFQRFQRGIVFWRVQVPDFFPSFLQTFFFPLSCRSIPWRPNFIGNPGRWPPCSELCVSRSLRVWNRTAWITFKSSWNIFSRRLPKLLLRWGNIFVEVNLFFVEWIGVGDVMWGYMMEVCSLHYIYVLVFLEQKWRDSVCKKMNLQVWPQQFVAMSRWFTCCRLVACLS